MWVEDEIEKFGTIYFLSIHCRGKKKNSQMRGEKIIGSFVAEKEKQSCRQIWEVEFACGEEKREGKWHAEQRSVIFL